MMGRRPFFPNVQSKKQQTHRRAGSRGMRTTPGREGQAKQSRVMTPLKAYVRRGEAAAKQQRRRQSRFHGGIAPRARPRAKPRGNKQKAKPNMHGTTGVALFLMLFGFCLHLLLCSAASSATGACMGQARLGGGLKSRPLISIHTVPIENPHVKLLQLSVTLCRCIRSIDPCSILYETFCKMAGACNAPTPSLSAAARISQPNRRRPQPTAAAHSGKRTTTMMRAGLACLLGPGLPLAHKRPHAVDQPTITQSESIWVGE